MSTSRISSPSLPLLLLLTATPWILVSQGSAEGTTNEAERLPEMLTIDWKKGPNLPQGFQDSQGDIIDRTLVSVCGFCSGQQGVPGKEGRYPRGFLEKTWGLNLDATDQGWHELPEFPGDARQGLQAIAVDNRLYCWGGFSYSKPYCHRDGYVLSQTDQKWSWNALPELPWPVTAAGMCAVGSRIFLCGGADYDFKQFYTATDRNKKVQQLGGRLLNIDTTNLAAGWQELKPAPGTPRWVHAMGAVDDTLYLFGGATGSDNQEHATYTVVDNWRYSLKTEQWNRLADLPVASGNFPSGAIVFANRYLLLVGGYQYGAVLNPDGSTRPVYGTPQRHDKQNPMCSDLFVFDTQTETFGRATSLPLNNNLPMTVLRGNQLHLIGGEIQDAVIEGEHFGHHPDLYLIGEIRLAK